jgi:hypothetical protein
MNMKYTLQVLRDLLNEVNADKEAAQGTIAPSITMQSRSYNDGRFTAYTVCSAMIEAKIKELENPPVAVELSDEEKTALIKKCSSIDELMDVLHEVAPLISNSRNIPVSYTASELCQRITNVVNHGAHDFVITRANGLRDKVIELTSK